MTRPPLDLIPPPKLRASSARREPEVCLVEALRDCHAYLAKQPDPRAQALAHHAEAVLWAVAGGP